MCERLLRLKMYLALLENEGTLTCNLTNSQWLIVSDLHILLKPFMIAQRLLEGQAYVTISLVPYMIYKARKGLVQAAASPASSEYVRSIATEMLQIFREHFGDGEDGTVATENLVPGRRRRPKGINMLALVASFLDPRMKGGVGISQADKVVIYDNIRSSMIEIAAMEVAGRANPAQHPNDFEQHAPHQLIRPLPADEIECLMKSMTTT